MKKSLTRRAFLRGACGSALALPLLESLGSPAFAQTAPQYPRRLIVFMHPMGMIMDAWTPTGTGASYQLSEILAPLESFRTKLNVLSGIDNVVNRVNELSNGHNSAARTLLTAMPFAENLAADGSLRPASAQVADGLPGGPSIDQLIAQRIGGATQLRSLDLGVGGPASGETQIFAAGRADPVAAEGDPRAVFDRLFRDLAPPTTGTPPPPSTRDRLRAKRGSVLHAVNESFQRIRGRVSSVDREKLDAHAQKVRELEARLGNTTTTPTPTPVELSCSAPTLALPSGYRFDQEPFDNVSSAALIDELVLAMACDLTRVGSLQFTHGHSPRFGWLGADIPGRWDNWHAMIHEARTAGGRPAMIQVMRWYTQQFAYLLQRMSEVREGEGTLLDHSLVLWVSDFGEGQAHRTTDLPIVLAGGLGGALPTGRHLAFQNRTTGDLYTSILNLFGFDDRRFGMAEYCTGPLAGLA